ncbi:MAG: CoA transferase [Acidobacteria bacterium]|nr:CoA transferase [Acidobacteriota bacterium]
MKPLQGITTLDLTRLLPGAVATMMLREAGATVVKIEAPGEGDYGRSMAPLIDGTGAIFRFTNAGKQSVVLDLKSESGKAALLRMAAGADVLVEGFRPGVMDRLGLGPREMAAVNPRLIFASLTGHADGSTEAGHDLNYLAAAGLLGWPPRIPAAPIADIAGGSLQLVNKILLALLDRARTGAGARLVVSMVEGLAPVALAPRAFAAAGAPNPLSGVYPCYNLYDTADGEYLAVAALEPKFWREFCTAVEQPDWISHQFDQEFVWIAADTIAGRDLEWWLSRTQGRDCCVNRVRPPSPLPLPEDPPPALGEHNAQWRAPGS